MTRKLLKSFYLMSIMLLLSSEAFAHSYFIKTESYELSNESSDASDDSAISFVQRLKDILDVVGTRHIGFKAGEYSPYTNQDMIKAYVEANKLVNSVDPDTAKVKEYYEVLVASLNDESGKWKKQTSEVNAFFNPNFSLVQENHYCQLYGWTIKDETVDIPKTGPMAATHATADLAWAKFDNAKGSVNLDGVENQFSTAATFLFEKANSFCSSNSVYSYGEESGYEMPLAPGETYTFTAQLGYRSWDQSGSAIFEIVNMKTGNIHKSSIITPTVCLSETILIPEKISLEFKTSDFGADHDNSLKNFDNLERYKLVVRNADPANYWTMVLSNISLYAKSDSVETPLDTVKVDIADVEEKESTNATSPVVNYNQAGDKYYVYESQDKSNSMTVSFNIPVSVMVSGQKYSVVIVLEPTNEAKLRPGYLSFGIKGTPTRYTDGNYASESGNGYVTIFGEYVYTGDKEQVLVYEFTASENLQNPIVQITTNAPADKEYASSFGLKDLSLVANDATFGIELTNSDRVNTTEVIYSIQGVKVSSLRKGMNVVRMSDGSVKKIYF